MSLKPITHAAVLLASLALPLAAFAQTAPPAASSAAPKVAPPNATPGSNGPTAQRHDMTRRVDQRIDQLHSELHITPAQQAEWDQFAQVMRDNAHGMDQMLDQRGAQLASMNAAETMQSYAQLAEQHATDVQKLASAFQPLYDSMSAGQKQNADTVFRGKANRSQHHKDNSKG